MYPFCSDTAAGNIILCARLCVRWSSAFHNSISLERNPLRLQYIRRVLNLHGGGQPAVIN